MHDPGNEFLRINLARTPLNRDKKKGWVRYANGVRLALD
jgi:hypothetical protein